ncbi:MAG: hypothetical protein MK081_07550 [Flavobacteriales bacterium]|nr:hypothetical protein [Flavobacteriales bacterium]
MKTVKYLLLLPMFALFTACGGEEAAADAAAEVTKEVSAEAEKAAEAVAIELENAVEAIEKREAQLDEALNDL